MMSFLFYMTEIQIIFENDDLVAISKPAGLFVHNDGVKKEPTTVDWFLSKYPESKGVGEEQFGKNGEALERSGVVHRLDRDTSGIMVLAKNQKTFDYLKSQWQGRLVKKEYRAFVYGYMKEKWGTIERPIGRSSKDFRLRSAQRGAKGTIRDAITNWELIVQGEYKDESFAYVKLNPKTGRMHQLRVHLKAVDRPIVGDVLYAGARKEQSNNLDLDRLALHAHKLEFTLEDGEVLRLIAPLPADFEEAAGKLGS